MRITASNALLVALTLSLPLGVWSRALSNPSSVEVRALESSSDFHNNFVAKRVEITEEPGPETDPTDPDPTTDPTDPQGGNPQNVPNPADIAGDGGQTAPSDPITGGALSPTQAESRGASLFDAIDTTPAGSPNKLTPDMSSYTFKSLPGFDDNGLHVLAAAFKRINVGLSADQISRMTVESKVAPPRSAVSADDLQNGILTIAADPAKGILIIPWMLKAADGTAAAEQNFASDLLQSGWSRLAGGSAGSLSVVLHQEIKNSATLAIMKSLIEPGVVKTFKPTDEDNGAAFNTLLGTDNGIISTRMVNDYPEFYERKIPKKITGFWTDDEDEDEDSSDGLEGAFMWIFYGPRS